MSAMITTIDNPFDPDTQFDDWFAFDEEQGYHTCSYLDRIAKTSSDLSNSKNQEIIENAIDEIIELDPLKIYKKIES